MQHAEIEEITSAGDDIRNEVDIDTRRLDVIAGDGVSLQCVNSSDFIVGKQTNFNGPVTIITYAEGKDAANEGHRQKEEIAPRARIAAPVAVKKPERAIATESRGKDADASRPISLRSLLTRDFLKIPAFAWILVLILIAGGCVTLVVELANSDRTTEILDAESIEGADGENYTYYERRHWKAAEEESSVEIKLPVRYVIISSSAGEECTGLRECGKLLRSLQRVQTKTSGADIYSSFFVSPDGSIFEGRGWRKRNAYQGFAGNLNVDVNVIGDFSYYGYPSERQIGAVKALIEHGVRIGAVRDDYDLIAANSTGIYLFGESVPVGVHVYEIIKNWPNFLPNPYSKHYGLD